MQCTACVRKASSHQLAVLECGVCSHDVFGAPCACVHLQSGHPEMADDGAVIMKMSISMEGSRA